MCVEIAYGLAANSLALLTDAADLASDSAGFVINIIALHYAKKKATDRLTFGYLKAEALGAFVSIILIWLLYLILIVESIEGIIKYKELDVSSGTMIIVSCCALALNVFKLFIVGGHSHGGGDSHKHGGGG
jgi:zinc transporter 2